MVWQVNDRVLWKAVNAGGRRGAGGARLEDVVEDCLGLLREEGRGRLLWL